MRKKQGGCRQLRLRKRTILVLNEAQVGEAAGAGSNISCEGGDCGGGATGNRTDCWETCNTCNCPRTGDPTCGASCGGTCEATVCHHTCADTCRANCEPTYNNLGC